MPQSVPALDQTTLDLESLTADVVALAVKAGASDAEAVVREGDEFSVNVRMGEVETLKESGSRGLGLRVFLGTRSASTSTSDLTPDGIRQLVEGAMALAKVTEEDPFTGLPETAEFGSVPGDLHLYFDDVYSLSGPERIEWARRCEAAALAADPRITNSDGGSFDAATGRKVMANSRGFVGGYRTSYAGVSAAPLAMDANGKMQRDGWWSGARRLADLESPEAIGKEAARRALRRLGARKVPTQRVPIVFAPEVARSLIGSLFEAASGDSIWRHASFLAGKLGNADRRTRPHHRRRQRHAAPQRRRRLRQLALRRRRPALAAHRRRRKRRPANLPAQHLLRPQAGPEIHPQRLARPRRNARHRLRQPLSRAWQLIHPIKSSQNAQTGLYVTSLMGFGTNIVTGDYSRGATGLWIENGQLTHAVEEVTIAGNLADMLMNVTAIGNDLVFRGSVASPTLRIDGMTIAGA